MGYYGLLAGFFVIVASIIGSLSGLLFKKISHKTNDAILGFAAGIMLTAAFIGLLPEAFSSNDIMSIIISVIGVFLGALTISLLDKFVPHIHIENYDEKSNRDINGVTAIKSGANKTLLLCFAIAIHNIPEGLATGLVFNDGVTSNAILVFLSMLIQKFPEGLIVIVPLLAVGMKKSKAILFSIGIAFLMIPGVLAGVFLGALPSVLTSFFYAFTFGAIIYVVSDEIIPESHEHGHERIATFALLIGVLVVALMQFIG